MSMLSENVSEKASYMAAFSRLLFFLVLIVFFLRFQVGASVVVTGRVSDPDGNPIEFATVTLDSTGIVSRADINGDFRIEMSRAHGVLTASATGYNSYSRPINLKADARIDFVLSHIAELKEVTVTAKSKLRRLRESEFTVNSINVEPVINTSANLSDLVGRTAGVRIRTTGGLGSDFDVSLNGLSGSAIRYFIDGVAMESRGSDISLENLPLNQVERIDIYKGVVPSFLGTDAMGGAINIITRKLKRNYLDASVSAGSFGTAKADLTGQIAEKRTGLLIRPSIDLSYSKNDYLMKDVEVWDNEADSYVTTDRRRFHDAYRSIQGLIDIGVENKPWAKRLFFNASYSNVDKEIQTGSVQAIVYGTPRRKSHAWSFGAIYAQDNFLTHGMSVNLSASHTWDRSVTVDTVFRKYDWNGNWIPTQRNEITGGSRSIRHYIRPLTLARANIDYSIAEIHTLNFNYSLNRTGNRRYDDVDTDYDPSKDVLTKHITGLSYSQALLDGRLQNTAFVKSYIEQLVIKQMSAIWSGDPVKTTTQSFWGYGIGSRFNLIESVQMKASVEKAVRLPLSREMLGNGSTVSPNLSLRPENSLNLNLGFFGNINPGGGHTFYYELSGYLRRVRDMIHLITNENTGLSVYSNISRVSVRGLEGEVGYHYADRFHLTSNWSYSVSRDKNPVRSDGKPSVTYNNRIPNRPWLYGNTEFTFIHRKLFNPTDRLRAGYIFQYVHWFFLTWEGYGSLSSKSKIPTQCEHSIYLTYSWSHERFNVTGEINNLFNATLYDNYKLQKPGRSFMVKFRLFLE